MAETRLLGDFFAGGLAAIVLIGCAWVAGYYIIQYLKGVSGRPVVCVCQVNDRIGVVLRRDYDKASLEFWKPYLSGKVCHEAGNTRTIIGERLRIHPTFVFRAGSSAYNILVQDCYVEMAVFELPYYPRTSGDPLWLAYEHIHGRSWNGHLVNP